eukprot:g6753.t1
MAGAGIADWAELQMQQAAEGGVGTMTPAQEADLNREQREVFQKINGRQYVYGLQLAASQRLHVLADETLVPKALSFFPFTVLSLFRAIEFLTQQQCITLRRVLQDEVSGPVDPAEISRQDPAHAMTMKEVCAVWMRAYGDVTKTNNLPPVGAIPAATAYQRATLIAMTVSLSRKFKDLPHLEKTMKKNNSVILTYLQNHGCNPVPAASSSRQPAPYNGGNHAGDNQKGGQNRRPNRGGGGGGKGKPAGGNANGGKGGGGKGANEHTCLDWAEGRCPGTSKATRPKGHWHCADKQRLRWLNTRLLDNRLTEERIELLCREVDNSPA